MAADDFFLDGLRDTGFYDRDPFNLDAVEVYKGPASTLFGRGSTGGVINQVSKTPQLDSIDEAMLTAGTSGLLRATADVDYALGNLSAIRIDAMGERTRVAERDDVLNQRYGFAPSVAFGIDKPTTLTLSYFHQDENNVPDYGIPFLFGTPAPVARGSYYGLVDDDRTLTHVDIATAHLTHDFGEGLAFQDTARYGNYWFDFRITAPHYGGGPGEPPLPVPGQALDTILVLRDRPSVQGVETTEMNESDLTYKFATGTIAHTLVTGIEIDRETDDLNRFANQIDQIPPTPLLDPDPSKSVARQTALSSRPDTTAFTTGIYALDTADFGGGWSAVGRFASTALTFITTNRSRARFSTMSTMNGARVRRCSTSRPICRPIICPMARRSIHRPRICRSPHAMPNCRPSRTAPSKPAPKPCGSGGCSDLTLRCSTPKC